MDTRPVAWRVLAVAYAATLVVSVWFVVSVWEPADGPLWEQWVFAVGAAAVLGLVAWAAALPLRLRVRRPVWYVAAAVFAAFSGLAATFLTFGLLFLPSIPLFVLAGWNAYGAFRVGGLGRGSAVLAVFAVVAVIWLVTGIFVSLALLILVVAAAIALALEVRRPAS